jgi:hypothetical protein
MKVPCYICEAPTEIDDIVTHLRRHSDEDYQRAVKKVIKGTKKAAGTIVNGPIDTSVGTVVKKKSKGFVQLDETREKVV